MKKILQDLGIDETFQKKPKRAKKAYSNFADNLPPIADYNFMADTLHMPTDKKGYSYLVVVVDLATHEFDMEPIKNLNSDEAPAAIKTMFKRKYIKKPYATLATDGDAEFKGSFA